MSDTTVSGWDILDGSHEALRRVVGAVPAGAWHLPTPCAGWDVTQVLQHAVGDPIGYADALARSARAWAGVDRDATEVPTPVPPHKMSPWSGSTACALDAAVHAWDIAVATGQASPLTPELARPLLKVAMELVEPLRAWG